ncbi:MAG TPA: GNAT family N-acetyltransferase [Actinopolymorphaceae bacterium]
MPTQRSADPIVREARPDDVAAICRFGQTQVRPYYAPLIGEEAAEAQVRDWWNPERIGAAVADGLVVVAEADGRLLGVAQRGRNGADHVVYKLYVHSEHRGRGLGPRLLAALTRQLPPDVDRLYIEHFAANDRAAAFYEREGFTIERVQPSRTGDPGLGIVWRSRPIGPRNA